MATPDVAVGAFAMVPCLWVHEDRRGLCWDEWVPTLGPKHEDAAELDFPWLHYHIDWRFVSDRMFDWCSSAPSKSPLGQVVTADIKFREISGRPVMKRRKCRREMPEFPALHVSGSRWEQLELNQRARCSKLKDGHICPHRGIDLRQFAQPDGTAICPGHGLRWDLKTGDMLPRHAQWEA